MIAITEKLPTILLNIHCLLKATVNPLSEKISYESIKNDEKIV